MVVGVGYVFVVYEKDEDAKKRIKDNSYTTLMVVRRSFVCSFNAVVLMQEEQETRHENGQIKHLLNGIR